MSKRRYNDIINSHKKIEQTDSVMNQFFLIKKFKSRRDRFYNFAKNAGSISSGFF